MNKSQVKTAAVVFHRVDFDGLFGFAIATTRLRELGYEVTPVPYNYGDPLEELPDWEDFDKIILTDISLPIEIMKELHDNYYDRTIWIDHHITAITNSEENGYSDLEGFRDIKVAACVLTCKYFYEDCRTDPSLVPYAIKLVGANDIWDKTSHDWDHEVQPFQFGLSLYIGMDPERMLQRYPDILKNPHEYVSQGRAIKRYMDDLQASWCDRFAFEVEVAGGLKGIAMICPVFSSRVFGSIIENFDVCVVAEKNRKREGVYNVSMYSEKLDKLDKLNFSCGEYMKENYGGGGHKGAAGGVLNLEQFVRLIEDHKI